MVVIFEFRDEMPGFYSAVTAWLHDQPAFTYARGVPVPDGSMKRVLVPFQESISLAESGTFFS
jgi:hypothetical protein